MTLLSPCIECDTITDQSLCPEHRPAPAPKPSKEPYDHQFRMLSERARKLQPFCLWCTSSEDLQTDHTPAAWERKAAGKPIRLQDVRVLCGPCNRLAGQAKPGPGQRTSEERPEPDTQPRYTGPGRLFTPGGNPGIEGGPTPGLRQSPSNSPGSGAAGRLVSAW